MKHYEAILKYDFHSQKQAARYRLQLTINDMQSSDSGIYFCNAQNSFGSISQAMKLQSRQKKVRSNWIQHPVQIK